MLRICLLGELQVVDGQQPLDPPPSKKTRALLAYLAATGRAQRRERLCELFWDLPDDPRGALRWSLTKLRGLLDRPERIVLVADRQSVSLDLSAVDVDLAAVRAIVRDGIDAATTADLKAAAERFRGPFLADLDMPNQAEVQCGSPRRARRCARSRPRS